MARVGEQSLVELARAAFGAGAVVPVQAHALAKAYGTAPKTAKHQVLAWLSAELPREPGRFQAWLPHLPFLDWTTPHPSGGPFWSVLLTGRVSSLLSHDDPRARSAAERVADDLDAWLALRPLGPTERKTALPSVITRPQDTTDPVMYGVLSRLRTTLTDACLYLPPSRLDRWIDQLVIPLCEGQVDKGCLPHSNALAGWFSHGLTPLALAKLELPSPPAWLTWWKAQAIVAWLFEPKLPGLPPVMLMGLPESVLMATTSPTRHLEWEMRNGFLASPRQNEETVAQEPKEAQSGVFRDLLTRRCGPPPVPEASVWFPSAHQLVRYWAKQDPAYAATVQERLIQTTAQFARPDSLSTEECSETVESTVLPARGRRF